MGAKKTGIVAAAMCPAGLPVGSRNLPTVSTTNTSLFLEVDKEKSLRNVAPYSYLHNGI